MAHTFDFVSPQIVNARSSFPQIPQLGNFPSLVPQIPQLGNFPSLVPQIPPPIQGTSPYSYLTKEEVDKWEEEDKESWERERKYLYEFEFKHCKCARKMSDLTEMEIKLWRTWLEKQYRGDEDIMDFFNKTEYWDGYCEEIEVMYFECSHDGKVDILIDMVQGWPRGNEVGGIFLDDKMIFLNVDQDIFTLDTTPDDLKERVDAYKHIRIQSCVGEPDYDDNNTIHNHCKQIRERYDKTYLECHPSDHRHFMN
jgi:hypothetical protein